MNVSYSIPFPLAVRRVWTAFYTAGISPDGAALMTQCVMSDDLRPAVAYLRARVARRP